MKKNSYETILYSVAGVAILLVVLIAFNALTATVKQRVDLTKEKAYTLSAGTKAILQKLDTPVKVRFYYSSSGEIPTDYLFLRNYAQQVRDLLDEYKQAAKGKIILEQYDPKPDSDAEDSARLDGVEGQMLPSGEKFYLGVSVSLLDAKEALPFLAPDREKLLEYDLSRAITRVVTPEKPVVGIMSPLPVFGSAANPMLMRMGQQGQDPWIFVNELKADFDVKQVEMTADKIDDNIKVLVVIHPKEITDQAQYAIDQFVLRGGKLIAFLDATSLVDSQGHGMGQLQMPGGGSSLDKLLKAWGLQYDPGKVAADLNYKMRLGGRNGQPTEAPAFLAVNGDGINKDDIVTSQINDVWIPLGGVFTGTPVAGLKETVLLKTTKESQLVDGMMAGFGSDNILRDFKPSGTEYALAVRLTGKFKTAFPDGKPKEEKKDEKKDDAKPAEEKKSDDTLKESKAETSVVLFGDADMIYDQFAVQVVRTLIGNIPQAMNGNLSLAQGLVEQMSGDSNLISVRSRASLNHPFTRIKAMEAKAEEIYQGKIKEFEESQRQTQERINDLQQAKGQGQQRFVLSPEQQAELEKLKKTAAETNSRLRQERKNLAREKESLKNTLKWRNILVMPAVVAISGLSLAVFKRKRTSAK